MRKKLLSVLLCVMMATSMMGCGKKNPASKDTEPGKEKEQTDNLDTKTESRYDGTIYYLNYKPEVSDAFQKVAEAYTNETGIKVKIETAASGTYESTLTAEMDKKDAPTIFVVDGATMLENWKDYCADLSGTELYSYLSDDTYTMNDGNGYIYGIAYSLEAWGIIVNKAIMNKYFALENKGTDFTSLDDLYTFENLKAVVEDMTANKEALGIEGVFGSTSLKNGDNWRYHTHLLNQALYWEWLKDGIDITGATPEFKFEYAENYKNIFDLYLNNSLIEPKLVGTKTVDDSMAEFALLKCAMIQNGDWSWNTIANTSGSVIKPEDIAFIPISTGVEGEDKMGLSVGASQYLCINKNASEEDQKAALDFLAWLFSSKTGKELVARDLQFVTPFTTMTDSIYTNPLFASENEINSKGKVAYPWCTGLIPSEVWKQNFGANLLLYAQGQMEWDDVVSAAVADWATEKELSGMGE